MEWEVMCMAKIDYEKVKQQITELQKDINVDDEVKALQAKLKNLSKDGAILIMANKLGLDVKPDTPKATIKLVETLRDGDDYVEIAGAVVSAYELRFFEVCPGCAKRVREQSGIFNCAEHGVVEPAYSYVWNILIDDGTGVIRVTLFSKQIERLLGMDSGQINKYRTAPTDFEPTKADILGKLLAFRGKVKVNSVSMRKEFTAKLVFKEAKDVEPRVEAVSQLTIHRDKIPPTTEEEEMPGGTQEELIR